MIREARSGPVRLVFEDVGSGSPAVVLVHGAFADRSVFAPQIDHLAAGHRVIAIDLRGHGGSDVPAAGFGFPDFVADMLSVSDAAGFEGAVVCGHSVLGAGIGLELAAARPDLVAGVAMLDASIPYPAPLQAAQLETFVPALEGEGRAQALQAFIGRISAQDAPDVRATVTAAVERAPAHMAAPLMRAIFSEDFGRPLSEGRYPLLHVHSSAPFDLARLREWRPDVLLGSVIGSGHYLTLSAADQVNAMLDRFLEIVAAHDA